jgi:prophage antirepressor-like protein
MKKPPAYFVPRLIKEFGYPETTVNRVAEALAQFQEPLASAFINWWESGVLPTIELEGYTISRLQKERGMNPIAAFLTLDWIQREPEKALRSLSKKWREIPPWGRTRNHDSNTQEM